ncbi:MAG TPA: hypothetical protein VK088_10270 [Acidimicrobiia bacterium]|nr:hypothetical protein [Acidimicrobiia bacterium]
MKSFEADDPLELIGHAFPVESEEAADREMARCFTEEYALMGFSAFEVGRLFESPAYVAPHAILLRRGPEFIRDVIREVYRR